MHLQIVQRIKDIEKVGVYMKYHPNGNLKNIMVFSAVANLIKNFTRVAVEFRL